MYRHCLDCNKDIYDNADFCPYCGGYLVIEVKSVGDMFFEKHGYPKHVNKSHRGLFSMLFGGIKAYPRMFVYPFILALSLSLNIYRHNHQTGILHCVEVFFATMWILSGVFSYKTYNEYAFRSEFTSLCFIVCIICRLIINL